MNQKFWLNRIGKGWHSFVKPLIETCDKYGIKIGQVKEKFGTLRFYIDHIPQSINTDFVYSLTEEAERKSKETCETCGDPGQLRKGGWLKTLCDSCNSNKRN